MGTIKWNKSARKFKAPIERHETKPRHPEPAIPYHILIPAVPAPSSSPSPVAPPSIPIRIQTAENAAELHIQSETHTRLKRSRAPQKPIMKKVSPRRRKRSWRNGIPEANYESTGRGRLDDIGLRLGHSLFHRCGRWGGRCDGLRLVLGAVALPQLKALAGALNRL